MHYAQNDRVNFLLYADDVKIYAPSTHSNELQNVLDSIFLWTKDWELPLSLEKCIVMNCGRNNPCNSYLLNNVRLLQAHDASDLGILMSENGCFNNHIGMIIKRAYNVINYVFRIFKSRNKSLLIKAYVTYVRPLLEYCTTVWSPQLVTLTNSIEKVQKYFTKRVLNYSSVKYEERLSLLKLESLKYRRSVSDLRMVFKIINLNTDLDPIHFFEFDNGVTRKKHPYKIKAASFKTNIRKHSFTNRIIPIWNDLSSSTVLSPNLHLFTKRLKSEYKHFV